MWSNFAGLNIPTVPELIILLFNNLHPNCNGTDSDYIANPLSQVTPMPLLHQLITVYDIGPCWVLSSPLLGRGIDIELTLLGLMHET